MYKAKILAIQYFWYKVQMCCQDIQRFTRKWFYFIVLKSSEVLLLNFYYRYNIGLL